MDNSDGRIIIDTELDPEDFERGAKRLHNKAESLVQEVNRLGETLKSSISDALRGISTAPLDRSSQSIEQAQNTADELRQKLEALENAEVQTATYKQLQTDLEKAEQELLKLYDRQEKMSATGVKENSAAWKNLQYDIALAEEKLARLERGKAALEASGGAVISGADTAEYQQMAAALDAIEARLAGMRDEISDALTPPNPTAWNQMVTLSGLIRNAFTSAAGTIRNAFTSAFGAIQSAASTVGTAIQHPIQGLDRLLGAVAANALRAAQGLAGMVKNAVVSGISRMAAAAKQAAQNFTQAAKSALSFGKNQKQMNTGLKSSFMTMLKYGFGIRSLYALFNRLRNAIKTGFSNLARFSDRTNIAISGLMSALSQFKNAVAAAFDPVLRVAAPALTQLINLLTQAATTLGALLAILTGQKTFIKAKEVQEDYAVSLIGTADAAKELGKTLDFDELHVLADDNESGGSGGTSPADKFEEVEVPSVFDGIADALANIWNVFRDAWENKGQAVVDAAQRALAALKQTALDVGAAFYAAWTEGTGQAFVESILGGVRSLLDLVTAFVTTFDEAWTSAGRGEGLIRSILAMTTEVINMVTAIGDSFAAVWNNGIGVSIWSNILEIITNVNTIIGNLAANFRKAWENNDVGKRVWQALLNMANDVLGAVNKITAATADWAGKLNFGPLVNALGVLLDAMEPLVDLISEGLAWAWENVLLPLGTWSIEAAAPALLEALGAGFEVLTAALEALQPFAAAIWDNFLQPLAQWTGETVVSAIKTVKDAFSDLLAWFNGDISLMELGYTLAQDFGGLAISLVTGIGEAIMNVDWGIVVAALGTVAVSIVGGFVELILGALAGAVDLMADGFSALGLDSVAGFLQGIADGLLDIGTWIKTNVIDPVVNWFKDLLGIHSPSTVFAEIGGYLIEGLLQGISNAWIGITKFFSGAISGLTSTLFTAWNNIKSTASTAWNNLKSTVSAAFTNLKTSLTSIGDKIKSAIDAAWDSVKTTASTKWANINGTVVTLWNGLKTSVGKVDWTSIGSNLVAGVKSGISNAWSSFKSWVTSTFSGVINSVKGVFGIHSPSKVFAEIGEYLDEGLIVGLKSGETGLLSSVKNLAGSVTDAMSDVSPDLDIAGPSMIGGLSAAADALSGIARTFAAIADTLTSMGGLQVPSIAAGTVVPYQTRVAGGNGANADDLNNTMLTGNNLLREILNMLGQIGENSEINITVESVLDGKVVARNTVKHINDMTLQAGRPVLLL